MEILPTEQTTADNKIVRVTPSLDHPLKVNLLYSTATTAPTAGQRTERVLL
jgi:hypothetical protein